MTPEDIMAKLREPRLPDRVQWKPEDLLSTGSTMLNLALSGRVDGGFCKGHYSYLVGDSSSGKTFLGMTCFAEASIDSRFDAYRLIYDNAEDGALMDAERYFGPGVAGRLEPPSRLDDGAAVYSETIEEFYDHLDDAHKGGTPFIYLLDSMDALTSGYELKKFAEGKRARRGGPKAKGDYGDGKAKVNSRYIRGMVHRLKDTGSILIIISQTRDNVDAGLFEDPRTRSGGHSLRFYATTEIWSSVGSALKKSVKGKDRRIGHMIRLEVRKNRLTGWNGVVQTPIYPSYGIDDVGGCVAYLVAEKHWPKNKAGAINPTADLDLPPSKGESLVRAIEANDLEDDVRAVAAELWADIEEAKRVKRKPRYGQRLDD